MATKIMMYSSSFTNPLICVVLSIIIFLISRTDSTKLSMYTQQKPCTVVYHQLFCSGSDLLHIPPLDNSRMSDENVTTYMDLSRNSISRITWELQLYPDLEFLSMENNTLKELHVDALYHLDKLQELYFGGNKLTSLDLTSETFQSQSNLRILDLSRNQLGPTFSFEVFRYLTSLTCLDLAFNRITTLSGFDPDSIEFTLNSLTELNIKHNYIAQVPLVLWPIVPNLIALDLSENFIVRIETLTFNSLSQLKSLDLHGLSTLRNVDTNAFAGLTNLEIIKLNDCENLHVINVKAFQGCDSLLHVNLSGSGLDTLQAGLLPYNSLQSLYLINVVFTCDCDLLWIAHSAIMQELIGTEQIVCVQPNSPAVPMRVLELTGRELNCPSEGKNEKDIDEKEDDGTQNQNTKHEQNAKNENTDENSINTEDSFHSIEAHSETLYTLDPSSMSNNSPTKHRPHRAGPGLSAGELFIVVTVCTLLVVVSSVAAYFVKQVMARRHAHLHYQYWILK